MRACSHTLSNSGVTCSDMDTACQGPESALLCPVFEGLFRRYKLLFHHLLVFPKPGVFTGHGALFSAAPQIQH